MKYLLKFLEEAGCGYDWVTLLVGRTLGLIETPEVTKYAEKYITNKPKDKNSLIFELAWNNEPQIVDENLKKLVVEMYGSSLNQDSSVWLKEERKWRYCMLKKIRMDIESHDQLLGKVAEIYSDMGYPKEMDNFIYYMPTTDDYDSTKFSIEKNQQRMIQLLDDFLSKEKLELIK